MAFIYDERVLETTTSTGTVEVVLDGAPDTSYQEFGGVMSNGDTTDVTIFGGGQFESCSATYVSATNKLTRGSIYASSNGGASVDFNAGTKTVIMSLPGAKAKLLFGDDATARSTLGAARFNALAANNIAINPAHLVTQENSDSSVAVTATTKYTTDNHVIEAAGIVAVTGQRVTDAPAGFSFSLKTTLTTAMPSPGATDLLLTYQPIEGQRVGDLKIGTADAAAFVVGEYVKSNVSGTFYAFVLSSGSDYVYLHKATLSADTWTFVPFAVASQTAGTWGTLIDKAMSVGWCMCAGSSRQSGTSSGWLAGNYRSGTDQTNWAASLTGGSGSAAPTFQRTGLVILPGTELPTSANVRHLMRNFANELSICKRHTRLIYHWTAIASSTTKVSGYFDFSGSPMRGTPSMTPSSALRISRPATASFTQSSPSVVDVVGVGSGSSVFFGADNFTGLTADAVYIAVPDTGQYILATSRL